MREERERLQVLLERIDPAQNMCRYYVISVEPTLFGDAALMRRWGRVGRAGQEAIELFDNAEQAVIKLETWLKRKVRRGHRLRANSE
jgi:predicted DNA-binding WGR domain protein